MPAIIRLLRSEIARLKAERSNLVGQRSELIAPLDVRIADIDQRLAAAERMLAAYAGAGRAPDTHRTRRLTRPDDDRQPLPFNREPTLAKSVNLTLNDVETVDIPSSLKGHRLRPNSKKAKIIKAIKALLQARGLATRFEMVNFLRKLGIMAHEKNPVAYLSVILSYSGEIFARNGVEWYLRDPGEADQLQDSSGEDRSEE